MACRAEADAHGHGHGHGDGGCDHDHTLEEEEDSEALSLYRYVNREGVRCLNAEDENLAQSIIRPWHERFGTDPQLRSDEADDDEIASLLLFIPFTTTVNLSCISLRGTGGVETPSHVKITFHNKKTWADKPEMDYSDAESNTPAQEFDLVDDQELRVKYPINRSKFMNVTTLVLFFTCPIEAENAGILFLGVHGVSTEGKQVAVEAVYESRALFEDHSAPADSKASMDRF